MTRLRSPASQAARRVRALSRGFCVFAAAAPLGSFGKPDTSDKPANLHKTDPLMRADPWAAFLAASSAPLAPLPCAAWWAPGTWTTPLDPRAIEFTPQLPQADTAQDVMVLTTVKRLDVVTSLLTALSVACADLPSDPLQHGVRDEHGEGLFAVSDFVASAAPCGAPRGSDVAALRGRPLLSRTC